MKKYADRWSCDSEAIYDYYFDNKFAPQEQGDGIVMWIKII